MKNNISFVEGICILTSKFFPGLEMDKKQSALVDGSRSFVVVLDLYTFSNEDIKRKIYFFDSLQSPKRPGSQ